jgi:hypothetical protein
LASLVEKEDFLAIRRQSRGAIYTKVANTKFIN